MEEQTLLYHEKQIAALCGVHCLNTLLQGPYFSEIELAQIGRELDVLEHQFMQEGGMHTAEYKQFQAEESGNVANDGMFSIQVLAKALEVWGLEVIPLDSPEVRAAREDPSQETAFICNLQEHWFAMRLVEGTWWNFNSLFPAPQPLSSFYLSAFLDTLRDQGYTIFVVRGEVPRQHPRGLEERGGRWVTPEEAEKANEEAGKARQQGRLANALENALARASAGGGLIALRPLGAPSAPSTSQGVGGHDQDPELAAAIAASLADGGGWGAGPSSSGGPLQELPRPPQPQEPAEGQAGQGAGGPGSQEAVGGGSTGGRAGVDDDLGDDEDPELAAAIAASMEDMQRPVDGTDAAASTSSASGQGAGLAGAAGAAAAAPSNVTATAQLEPPGPEPEDGPGVVTLAVRMPDGRRTTRRFAESASVLDLYGWLASQHVDPANHVLCTQFPRLELGTSSSSSSLRDVGLTGRQVVTAEKRQPGFRPV